MSRRKNGDPVNGIVLLDKPTGVSSNHALQQVRRLFNARKAGHTGNLDPLATGMLPLCMGEATKTAAFMLDADKSYQATALLGQATETGDSEGAVIQESPVPELDDAAIANVLCSFEGEIDQTPPMYSALKHQGQPLYKLARAGKTVERKSRRVHIRAIRLLAYADHQLSFEVTCSKGTYVRTLSEDIATKLGTCAHLVALRRVYAAPFQGQAMVTLEQLQQANEAGTLQQHLLPEDAGLLAFPRIELDRSQAAGFCQGMAQQCAVQLSEVIRVYAQNGPMLGLGTCVRTDELRPVRVFPGRNPD